LGNGDTPRAKRRRQAELAPQGSTFFPSILRHPSFFAFFPPLLPHRSLFLFFLLLPALRVGCLLCWLCYAIFFLSFLFCLLSDLVSTQLESPDSAEWLSRANLPLEPSFRGWRALNLLRRLRLLPYYDDYDYPQTVRKKNTRD
jgi:hypothetical protein